MQLKGLCTLFIKQLSRASKLESWVETISTYIFYIDFRSPKYIEPPLKPGYFEPCLPNVEPESFTGVLFAKIISS